MPEQKHPYTPGRRKTEQAELIEPKNVVSLAITQNKTDLAFLQRMYDDANWTLHRASTYREGMVQLSLDQLQVTLCECQLPDGTWKDVLSHLAPWHERPRLIVISKYADEKLWSEVLALGGFDVLRTPLKETEAAYAIGSAWLDWQSEHRRGKKHELIAVSH